MNTTEAIDHGTTVAVAIQRAFSVALFETASLKMEVAMANDPVFRSAWDRAEAAAINGDEVGVQRESNAAARRIISLLLK